MRPLVLFDTNTVSFGFTGATAFRRSLELVRSRLPLEHELVIAPTTFQELGHWARVLGIVGPVIDYLLDEYDVLVTDVEAAGRAAEYQQLEPKPIRRAGQSQSEHARDKLVWSADASIIGCADVGGVTTVVSADQRFRFYRSKFPGSIYVVLPDGHVDFG